MAQVAHDLIVTAFEELQAAFLSALERGDEPLERYLDRAGPSAADLRERVAKMVRAHESRTGHLETPPGGRFQIAPVVEPGMVVGGCRIVRPVGQGGMGVVYEAEQQHPRRRVAIKVLSAPLASKRWQRRIELEANALARLRHPGIATIHDAGSLDRSGFSQPFLVMEFIEGRPLRELLESGELTVDDASALLESICEAMEHAHERGVVHRDLKPENILVDDSGAPHIVDFGIAKLLEEEGGDGPLTGTAERCCTMAYAAPEQVAPRFGPIGPRTDVYALGILVHECLTGERPYVTDRSLEEAIHAIVETQPDEGRLASAGVAGSFRAVIRKALRKCPQARYADAAELREDLVRARRGQQVHAAGSSRPAGKPLRAARVTAVVIALALLLGVGWIVTSRQPETTPPVESITGTDMDRIRLLAWSGQADGAQREAWKELIRRSSGEGPWSDVRSSEDLLWAMRVAYAVSPRQATFGFPGAGTIVALAGVSGTDTLLVGDSTGRLWTLDTRDGRWEESERLAEGSIVGLLHDRGTLAVLIRGDDERTRLRLRADDSDEPLSVPLGEGDWLLAAGGASLWAANDAEIVRVFPADGASTRYSRSSARAVDSLALDGKGRFVFLRDEAGVTRFDVRSGEETAWPLDRRSRHATIAIDERGGRVLAALSDGVGWIPVDAEPGTPWRLIDGTMPYADQLHLDPSTRRLTVARTQGVRSLTYDIDAPTDEPPMVADYDEPVRDGFVSLSAGRLFTRTAEAIQLWETRTSPHLTRLPDSGVHSWHSAIFGHDGRVITAGAAESGSPLPVIRRVSSGDAGSDPIGPAPHTATVAVLVRSPDDGVFFSAGHDGRVVKWTPEGPELLFEQADREIWTLALSRTGNRLAFSGKNGRDPSATTIDVLNVETGRIEMRIPADTGGVKSVAFSPDGTRLVAVGRYGWTRLYDLSSEGAPASEFDSPGDDHRRAVAWNSDGRWIAIGDDGGAVRVIDAATGVERHLLSMHGRLFALAFSPVRPTLLAAGTAGGSVVLLDVETGAKLTRVTDFSDLGNNHSLLVFALDFSPDGRHLLISGGRSNLTVADLAYYDSFIRGNLDHEMGEAAPPAEIRARVREWVDRWALPLVAYEP